MALLNNDDHSKSPVEDYEIRAIDEQLTYEGLLGGTASDAKDMQRMGKKQELRVNLGHAKVSKLNLLTSCQRNFRLISIVGFVVILQSTWESALLYVLANHHATFRQLTHFRARSAYFGLLNGGTAGVIWMTIITWLFLMAMIASLAEMASMAPTAGGQYHWVSEFAPPSFQKPLSYIVGTNQTHSTIISLIADR